MKNLFARLISIAAVIMLTAGAITGCGSSSSGGGTVDGSGVKVFFLHPDPR